MSKREWLPSSKSRPCCLCGNHSGWCSTSVTESDTITCKNTTIALTGWKKLKDTTDGGGVFKPLNGEERPQTPRLADPQTDSDDRYQPTNHQTRDRVYRRLMLKNGYLSSTYRAELKRRSIVVGLPNGNGELMLTLPLIPKISPGLTQPQD